jgi:hypothetical protein
LPTKENKLFFHFPFLFAASRWKFAISSFHSLYQYTGNGTNGKEKLPFICCKRKTELQASVYICLYMFMYIYIIYIYLYMLIFLYICCHFKRKSMQFSLIHLTFANGSLALSICIAGQKIIKALMFNGQRIVGLCESLTVNNVNLQKVSNGSGLTALKQILTMSMYLKYC